MDENKPTKEEIKTTALIATGLLTEHAFLKSLSQSKTLKVMAVVSTILFGGFCILLYKMAGA